MRKLFKFILILTCFTALFLTCYGPALFRDGQFADRDAGHYYYPLHQRVQAEWHAGRWPLWELEENAGMPLLGNPAAAVLYPGKLVFAFLPFAWGARAYVVAHTALAFLTMLVLMRSWGTSWVGSALSALSYSFGAPVLLQHSNVIYLVGAAWLPLGLHAVDRWVRLSRRWALLELAIVLAMQVLGGDLESAYLLGLAAGGYAAGITWSRVRKPDRAQRQPEDAPPWLARRGWLAPRVASGLIVWGAATVFLAARLPQLRPRGFPPRPFPWMAWMPWVVAMAWVLAVMAVFFNWMRTGRRFPFGVAILGLAISAGLAMILAAAQLLPVIEFAQQTVRSTGAGPHDIYPFSIEPFRLVELAWPDFLGVHLGGNTYWREAMKIPGIRPELWTPSLYLGGLTLILACGELGFRRGPPWRVWLTFLVVVSLLGSLGRYASPIWVARFGIQTVHSQRLFEWARNLGGFDPASTLPIRFDGCLRDGDGGVYWWLTTVLPGFRQFRFPAKLFTFTALGIAALAGAGWDSLCSRGRFRGTLLFTLFLLGNLTMLALVWIERAAILTTFHSSVVSSIFGPFDADGGFLAILRSLAQASIVAGAGLLIARIARTHPAWAGAIAMATMTADLAAANAHHVLTVPQATLESKPEVLRVIEDDERRSTSRTPFRVYRMPSWEPQVWQMETSSHRALDFVSWERETLKPKYGINLGVEYTQAFGVGGIADFEQFFSDFTVTMEMPEAARMLGAGMGQKVIYYPRRSFDLWNTRYWILPCDPRGWREEYRSYASFVFRSERIYPQTRAARESPIQGLSREWMDQQDYQVWRNLDEFPRAWVVHDARWVDPASSPSANSRDIALREILFANDPLWHDATRPVFNPRTLAWVDAEKQAELTPFLPGHAPAPTETVEVTYPTPQRAELDAVLESPGLVILADVYYPGWGLTIDGKPAPIYPVNRLMRGAAVPAGRHRLVYSYAPRSFQVGLLLSVLGITGLVLICLSWALRPIADSVQRRSPGISIS